jgi:hypothetical protein
MSKKNYRKSIVEDPVERSIAISWVLDAMKNVLGYEDVRKTIIQHYFPGIPNAAYIKTFDAIQQYKKKPFDNKEKEIEAYCREIVKLPNEVVFTATNIQRDADDMETHYQSYLVDNNKKKIYVIDPARKATRENGGVLYYAEVTEEVIKPLFTELGYKLQYIEFTNPPQIHETDVFCQSWSLFVLLQILDKGIQKIKIPKKQIDKYEVLLGFYKEILGIDDLPELLYDEYVNIIDENRKSIKKDGGVVENLLIFDPVDVIIDMKPTDMLANE